ncbi:hypothetical protein SAMN05444920_10540 [Nonomuraea solani]|uniref:Uncharacterized protein n=1 Tax=Nonomuraea solani TaxID=1144553 RepID=A0A1H6DA93_9ACTN|nr:hypothetical protein SAMN05444920_10540 [Nonomuraea solani]
MSSPKCSNEVRCRSPKVATVIPAANASGNGFACRASASAKVSTPSSSSDLASVASIVPAASSLASARMTVLLAANASTAATYWSTFAAVAVFRSRACRRSPVSTHSHRSSGCSPNICRCAGFR